MAQSHRSLSGALRELQRTAPKEAEAALQAAVAAQLPAIRAATPRGRTGRLAAGTTITRSAKGPVVRNPLPYANTIHWGRKQVQGVPSVVQGRAFAYGILARRASVIEQALRVDLERRITRTLNH